jgi:hypothetical protein
MSISCPSPSDFCGAVVVLTATVCLSSLHLRKSQPEPVSGRFSSSAIVLFFWYVTLWFRLFEIVPFSALPSCLKVRLYLLTRHLPEKEIIRK